ncbi:MAG: hypothetical protein ABIQ04_00380 [Candidatus Saccharimonadales bacterium]
MKELDFDELDRAVSSLMSDASSFATSAPDGPKEKILDIPLTDTQPASQAGGFMMPGAQKVDKAEDDDDADEEDNTPVVKAPPAIRRSNGRFMDVVHPSSDMKQAGPSFTSAPRQGISISPAPSVLAMPTEPPKPVEPIEQTPTAAPVVSEPEVKEEAATSDWPDPLDMAKPSEEKQEEKPEEKVLDTEPDTELAAALESLPAIDEEVKSSPLASPFLSDTKVEKRPLGGSGSFTVSEQTNALASDVPVPEVTAEDQTVTDPTAFEAPLPEEFQSDLVAIESGEANEPTPDLVPAPVEAPALVVTTKMASAPERVTSKEPVKALIPDHFPDEDLPKGPSSIAQQYREEASTGDQTNGSIYDTDSYHKPLAHPAKKKASWLWIVWILLILAVGAGIGAGLYYFGIVK